MLWIVIYLFNAYIRFKLPLVILRLAQRAHRLPKVPLTYKNNNNNMYRSIESDGGSHSWNMWLQTGRIKYYTQQPTGQANEWKGFERSAWSSQHCVNNAISGLVEGVGLRIPGLKWVTIVTTLCIWTGCYLCSGYYFCMIYTSQTWYTKYVQ